MSACCIAVRLGIALLLTSSVGCTATSTEGGSVRDCSDGTDNDGDGTTDCEDDGCINSPDCGATGDDDDATGDDDDGAPVSGPTRYPEGRVHSPIGHWAAEGMRAIAEGAPDLHDDVFMKVGASSTVSIRTLHCFADEKSTDLGEHTSLLETLDWFRAGDAGGSTSFDRQTLAARSGHSAGWAVGGDPSPMEEEWTALRPRFAIVHYGTNDMGLGSSYASAMPGFHANMQTLVRGLVSQGTIPILTGISPRLDRASADLWVPSYNALIRGIAQQWQIPFVDLWWAQQPLEGFGMAGDGLHLEAYGEGACLLTAEGLTHGYNVRNLIVLEALDRVRQVVLEGASSIGDIPKADGGEGTSTIPLEIAALPWSDDRSTLMAPQDEFDSYACAPDTDESGPEWVYRFTLDEETAIRALVMDEGDVDIDLHLLDASGSPEGCLARAHQMIETTLEAGSYHLVLDTWVDGTGRERTGPYQLVLLACAPSDPDCD